MFAPAEKQGEGFGETTTCDCTRIRSGEQTITVLVLRKPFDAGIDSYVLLIDLERFDNVGEVESERHAKARRRTCKTKRRGSEGLRRSITPTTAQWIKPLHPCEVHSPPS